MKPLWGHRSGRRSTTTGALAAFASVTTGMVELLLFPFCSLYAVRVDSNHSLKPSFFETILFAVRLGGTGSSPLKSQFKSVGLAEEVPRHLGSIPFRWLPAIRFLSVLAVFRWFSGWVSEFNPLKVCHFSRGI